MDGRERFDIHLRRETEADHAAVEALTRQAFWNVHRPGCDEHYLVHVMRAHADFRPDLDFVAEVGGRVVGHIAYTRSRLAAEDGAVLETLTFGPLSVLREFQRRGVGKALIAHTMALAATEGCPAVVIFGNPTDYASSGFQGCAPHRVGLEGGRYPTALLVRVLRPGALAGHAWTFHESAVYHVDPQAAETYDARFPPLEKGYRSSQEVFAILSRSFVE
jgi:predicted N-acetyltransferase YhbS